MLTPCIPEAIGSNYFIPRWRHGDAAAIAVGGGEVVTTADNPWRAFLPLTLVAGEVAAAPCSTAWVQSPPPTTTTLKKSPEPSARSTTDSASRDEETAASSSSSRSLNAPRLAAPRSTPISWDEVPTQMGTAWLLGVGGKRCIKIAIYEANGDLVKLDAAKRSERMHILTERKDVEFILVGSSSI